LSYHQPLTRGYRRCLTRVRIVHQLLYRRTEKGGESEEDSGKRFKETATSSALGGVNGGGKEGRNLEDLKEGGRGLGRSEEAARK